MACATELSAAASCVSSNAAGCSCFGANFTSTFPSDILNAYRKTMAFEIPGDPAFCTKANSFVCNYFTTTGSCCCKTETEAYAKCAFTSILDPQFGATGCEQSCGGSSGGGTGGGGMMPIIAIVVVLLLVFFGGFFCYRRRRRLRLTKEAEEKEKELATEVRKRQKKGLEILHF